MKTPIARPLQLLAGTAIADAVAHPFDGLVAATSVGLASFALLCGLALASGLDSLYRASGSDRIAVFLASSSVSELNSAIAAEQVHAVQSLLFNAAAVDPATSAELYLVVNARRAGASAASNVALRGLGPAGIVMRDTVKLETGRWVQPGAREIAVGRAAAARYSGLQLGQRVRLASADWTVVGTFCGGGVAESELWTDIASVRGQFRNEGTVQSIRAKLPHGFKIPDLRELATRDPRLRLSVISERDYYSGQSAEMVRLVRNIGAPVCVLLAVGALITVYSSVRHALMRRLASYRTLHALGMDPRLMLAAAAIETIAIALVGALAASIAALVSVHGSSFASLGQAFTEASFHYRIDAKSVLAGSLASTAIALAAAAVSMRSIHRSLLFDHRR